MSAIVNTYRRKKKFKKNNNLMFMKTLLKSAGY